MMWRGRQRHITLI